MTSYEQIKAKIIATLMGRPAGTEIQPDQQQDYTLNMLDYTRSLELIATSTLMGIAEATTTPLQPDSSKVCYIAGIGQNRTVTFQNFHNQNGTPISITTNDMQGVFVILLWNQEYWSYESFETNIISHADSATFYYRYNIRKTYESVALMNSDVSSPIGTDGKYIKVGDIVTIVNSTTPSENGIYSYEGATDGWKYQSSFNFQLSQDFGNNNNISISQNFFTEKFLIDDVWIDDSTPSPSEYFKIRTFPGSKYKSYNGSSFFRVVFLNSSNVVLSQSVTGLDPDIPYSEIQTPDVSEICYIKFQRLTGTGVRVIFENNIATNSANIATNSANIATNSANIVTNTANIVTNTANIVTNTGIIRTGVYYNKSGVDESHPTVSSSPKISCTNTDIIKFQTSANGDSYYNVVFFDSNGLFISSLLTTKKELSGTDIPTNTAFIGINQVTGQKQIVWINGLVVFNYQEQIRLNQSQIATNSANIAVANGILTNMKSDKSSKTTYLNLMSNVNSIQIFSDYSTFLNPGYKLQSSVQNSFARTTNPFTYTAGHRVALVAKIKFDAVTDDFRLQFGFNTGGWDSVSPDYTAASFGLNNLTWTTQTFALIWDATKASNPLFYIYKAEVADGQTEEYTILDFAVMDMGADSTNELYNKTNTEIANIFKNCTVLNADIFYNDFIVKKAEEVISVSNEIIVRANKSYNKKLITIGDSLTANLVWQPKLQEYTGIQWSSLETGTGVGYVNILTGVYTTEDKSGDANYRKAYKMAIGGTAIKPTSIDSIYMRSFDAVFYNPNIIFIYGGQNDGLSDFKTSGNTGTTPDEIVKNEIAYKTNAINGSISVIAAYKGMIENLMTLCPNAIIYLVTQMRVLGRVGMLDSGGNVRFPTMQSVIDWEFSERYPKVEYIRSIGKLYGLPVIDLWNESGITDYNAESWYGEPATDCTQVHPDTIGYYRMAEVMEKNL